MVESQWELIYPADEEHRNLLKEKEAEYQKRYDQRMSELLIQNLDLHYRAPEYRPFSDTQAAYLGFNLAIIKALSESPDGKLTFEQIEELDFMQRAAFIEMNFHSSHRVMFERALSNLKAYTSEIDILKKYMRKSE